MKGHESHSVVSGLRDKVSLCCEDTGSTAHGPVLPLLRMTLLRNGGSTPDNSSFLLPSCLGTHILVWNQKDGHFHVNWVAPTLIFLLSTLPLPNFCCCCGLCCWAKDASFDATSDKGSNLWLLSASLSQRTSQPSSTLYTSPESMLPSTSPPLRPFL